MNDAGLQLVKKGFDKLVDGGASSPARCRVKISDFAVGSFAKGET